MSILGCPLSASNLGPRLEGCAMWRELMREIMREPPREPALLRQRLPHLTEFLMVLKYDHVDS